MKELELLAPARNADIGIAAIDCGADAVYIAGPKFGARQAAGNSVADISRLCAHAHRFGARVFITVNTIIYEDELDPARELVRECVEAGADALIVQDLALLQIVEELVAGGMRRIPLHASTQTSLLDTGRAGFLSSLGFSRLVLERELTLEDIRRIREAAPQCELEFFVHGALCVCYSGQCYLSEAIAGRSANRGACIQACRSRYDLVDQNGKVLVKDKALLSLKDYRLLERLEDLADAGVCSFKIEGRLKNGSYVRNVVREYSTALDRIVAESPDKFRRASFGHVAGSFTPALDKTFNRGYTELYMDGIRGKWASMDAAKGMGEEIGKIISARHDPRRGTSTIELECPEGCVLANGDGFCFVAGSGDVIGFRGDICENLGRRARIRGKACDMLYKGARIFRNYDSAFEKEIARNPGTREMTVFLDVEVSMESITARAETEDGRTIRETFITAARERADNPQRLEGMIRAQLEKKSGGYRFAVRTLSMADFPLVSSAFLNGIRRALSEKLDAMPSRAIPMHEGHPLNIEAIQGTFSGKAGYRFNVSNSMAREIYRAAGATETEPAYEIAHQSGVELMRTRYCLRHELGLCLREHPDSRRLFLVNNGRRLALVFDCARCEMAVREV